MKQLIVPVAIIVGLIVFFVITDRREFNHYNDDQTAPHVSVESAPAIFNKNYQESVSETKSVAKAMSLEKKSTTETKPVPKIKSAENVPEFKTKPAEDWTSETPSASKTKPMTGNDLSKRDSFPAPVAVPVLSPAEAEKANREAVLFARDREEQRQMLADGYSSLWKDDMTSYRQVTLSESEYNSLKEVIQQSKETLEHFEQPSKMVIDWKDVRGRFSLSHNEGFEVESTNVFFRMYYQPIQIRGRNLTVDIDITCLTEDTVVELGFIASGLLHPGKCVCITEDDAYKKGKTKYKYEINCKNGYDDIKIMLGIKGKAVIHNVQVWQKELLDYTIVEGEIIERSQIPDPAGSDYPNCLFTLHFKGNSIKAGQSCPKELSLICKGFEDFKSLETDSLNNGDKIICTIMPFENLPEEEQSTQRADDLNFLLLSEYYVLNIQKISSFSDNSLFPNSGIFFSDGNDDYVSIFEQHINPPVSQEIADAQKQSIQNALSKMNNLLDGYDESMIREVNVRFSEAWKNEKAKDSAGYNRVYRKEGSFVWRNIDNSFWTLPEQYTLLSKSDNLNEETLSSFKALKDVCEANGVQLIISLVPNLNVISSRVINQQFRNIPDLQTATYVKELSEIGIECIYCSDKVIDHYNRFPFAFFYPLNGHPSDTVQDVISDILAERLARYHFSPDLDHSLFSTSEQPHAYGEDAQYLFPTNCDIADSAENTSYKCREVLYNKEKITRNPQSGIIVVGNSYIQTPMESPDSLPTLISSKLSTSIDWYRIGSYGPFSDILSQLLRRPAYFLKDKKVFIMQFGTDHLNFANERKIMLNIAQADNARLALNNKTIVSRFVPESDYVGNDVNNSWNNFWNALPNKVVFSIGESGEQIIKTIQFGNETNNVDLSKPICCIVNAVCFPHTSCDLVIGEKKEPIPSFNSAAKYFSLFFELPVGTKEITIKANGTPGTLFAIKDIEIRQ